MFNNFPNILADLYVYHAIDDLDISYLHFLPPPILRFIFILHICSTLCLYGDQQNNIQYLALIILVITVYNINKVIFQPIPLSYAILLVSHNDNSPPCPDKVF